MARKKRMNHDGSIVVRASGRCEWRRMIDGQMQYITAASIAELNRKIKRSRDIPIGNGKIKVSDWNNKWLDVSILPLTKKATYAQYMYMIRHVDKIIGKRYMKTIKPSDIQHVIAAANADGLSTATMKHIRKVMHLSFEQALADQIVGKNPVENIVIPLKQSKQRKVFTPHEMKILFDNLQSSRWASSVKFCLETGMRKGELLALKWSDIDITNKRVKIDESLDIDGIIGDIKNVKEHYAPLSKNAIQALMDQKHMLKMEGNPSVFRSANHPEAWVFPNRLGHALKPGSYYTVIARVGNKSGIKASPHMLRHTFVSITRGEMNIKDLQNILGHDEMTSTLDLYGNILNDKTTEMAESVDAAFGKFDIEMKKEPHETKKDGKVVRFTKIKTIAK